MSRRYTPKDTDQEECHKASMLMNELIQMNESISANAFMAAMKKIIAVSYHYSDVSYREFVSDINEYVKYYKSLWVKDEE